MFLGFSQESDCPAEQLDGNREHIVKGDGAVVVESIGGAKRDFTGEPCDG